MGEKAVTDLAGIGEVLGKRMESKAGGIFSQKLGIMLYV